MKLATSSQQCCKLFRYWLWLWKVSFYVLILTDKKQKWTLTNVIKNSISPKGLTTVSTGVAIQEDPNWIYTYSMQCWVISLSYQVTNSYYQTDLILLEYSRTEDLSFMFFTAFFIYFICFVLQYFIYYFINYCDLMIILFYYFF